MPRLRALWLSVHESLWFVPTLIVCAAIALAVVLVEMHPALNDMAARWPRIFGAGADGSRAMLTAIATSMITVAGVVFSITIVALSLTASQYSPRVLRNFMSDRPTQIVLGTFVAIFAYCLVVLRTIRGGDEGAFVPSLAVLGGVGMAVLGVGLLIYFVHHVATTIQVSTILERLADDAAGAIDRLFPAAIGEPARIQPPCATADPLPDEWLALRAKRGGYVVGIDGGALLECAAHMGRVLKLVPAVGDFVIEGRELLLVSDPSLGEPESTLCSRAMGAISFARQRTVHQDPRFGVQQIVDVALKALSPSTHDPTTALQCVDHLTGLMVRLSGRSVEGPHRFHKGRLRLVVEGPDYPTMIGLAFDAIVHHAGTHAEVYERIVDALARIASATEAPARRAVLRALLHVLLSRAALADLPAGRFESIDRSAARLSGQLDATASDMCRACS